MNTMKINSSNDWDFKVFKFLLESSEKYNIPQRNIAWHQLDLINEEITKLKKIESNKDALVNDKQAQIENINDMIKNYHNDIICQLMRE